MAIFCDELKRERLKRKLTQEEMSNLLGLKRSTYSLYESGKRIPKIETLDQIAEALDCFIYYDYETHQHRLIAYEDGQVTRSIRTYADPDPENTRKKFQERLKNVSGKIDYDQSYSYASSEEELDKHLEQQEKQKEETTKNAPKFVVYDENGNEIKDGKAPKFTSASRSHAQTEAYDLFHSLLSEDWIMTQEQETTAIQLKEMLGAYNRLNNAGRKEAVKRVDELTEIPRYTKPDEPPQD